MGDRFLGSWLVAEYVHAPNGRFIGRVRQRRELHQLENGRIRVVQICQPEASLNDHPMSQFEGEWVFDLSVSGRNRLYHGPDVIGSGQQWMDGVMTGSGLWPNFGYAFRSYACLITPERQLTGGKFFMAGKLVANIVGLAVPESDKQQWPELSLDAIQTHDSFSGLIHRFEPNGEQKAVQTVTRIPHKRSPFAYQEQRNGEPFFSLHLDQSRSDLKNEWNISGSDAEGRQLVGLGRQIGPMLEAELYDQTGTRLELFDCHDEETGTMFSLRRQFEHDQLQAVDILLIHKN